MNEASAHAWLERHGLVTLTSVPGVPSLVGEIIGPVRGSWWGHPKGALVYRVATALEGADDVFAAKLVAGKVTFVHATLWPAVLRLALDAERLARARRTLSAASVRLVDELAIAGEVRMDVYAKRHRLDAKAAKAARQAVEEHALALVSSEHTERGAHATVLRRFEALEARSPGVLERARALDGDAARHALRSRTADARVPLLDP